MKFIGYQKFNSKFEIKNFILENSTIQNEQIFNPFGFGGFDW